MSSEIDYEAVPGIPGTLPEGERIVWQGRPQWKAMARHTFKVRWLAAYFSIFVALRLFAAVENREGVTGALHVLLFSALATACIGVVFLLAWLNARSTIYTLTTRRIVLRIGVALPMTWNLPFKRLASADLQARKEGDGDIVLHLKAPDRIAWLSLWPHVQPWHLMRARPALRAIPEPARVAALLSEAARAWSTEAGAALLVAPASAFSAPASEPLPQPIRVDVAAEAGR